MLEAEGVIERVQSFHGRAPKVITIKTSEASLQLSTFDGAIYKLAANNIGKQVKAVYIEKPGKKDPSKIYKNLETLTLLEAPVEAVVASEGAGEGTPAVLGVLKGTLVPQRQVDPLDAIARLEMGFRVAVRQRELLEEFIRSRFKEGEHFMDGATFGSKKRVLLQPGAQLIHYAHGHAIDFEIVHGPMDAPKPDTPYTITMKAVVRKQGDIVGHGVGSCTSLIWSGKTSSYRDRAVDPDKTHNATLKIAKKRALVDSCLNTTAAAEYFSQDLEEGGYGDEALTKRRS